MDGLGSHDGEGLSLRMGVQCRELAGANTDPGSSFVGVALSVLAGTGGSGRPAAPTATTPTLYAMRMSDQWRIEKPCYVVLGRSLICCGVLG